MDHRIVESSIEWAEWMNYVKEITGESFEAEYGGPWPILVVFVDQDYRVYGLDELEDIMVLMRR